MDNVQSDALELVKQFSKPEMVKISREIGLEIDPSLPSTKIVIAVLNDLDERGVPETSKASKLLKEFLYSSSYTDEAGNLLESEVEEVAKRETVTGDELPENLPECYRLALADERDPSCNKCIVFDSCHKNRIARRPECYGLMFDQHAEECIACFEAVHCKIATMAKK